MNRHVLLALWDLGRGGAERMVVDLARRLPNQGYVPRIVALGGGGPLEDEIRSYGIDLDIGPETSDRRETKRFADQILASLPMDTIVHTHLGADHWMGLKAKKRGHAWVSTCHNDDRDDSWWKRRLKVWTWNQADRVACVSEAVVQFWKERGLTSKQVITIPNGVDLERFTPKTRMNYADVPVIITIGRLVAQKRQAWLLRALAPIKSLWRLEVIGDGPLRNELETIADELGIRPRVSFRGVLADVRPQLSRADIFAFPSAWEGQGIVVLEAAASGVPLVLSDHPVFHEWLSEDSATFVPEEIDAWTERLQGLLMSPERAQKQAWAAYQDVCRVGSLDTMVASYVACYREAVKYAHSTRQ